MEDENNDTATGSSEDELDFDVVRYPFQGVVLSRDSPPQDVEAEGLTFDEDLPAAHTYLGDNLEAVSGRVIFTEGAVVCIPLLPRSYGTLLPGLTFPLSVRDYSRTSMLRKCVNDNNTFGCISKRYYRDKPPEPETYGTTAEIYEFSDDGSTVAIKAMGRQRFKMLNTKRSKGGYLVGEVEILPEVILPKPFSMLNYTSLSCLPKSLRHKRESREAQLTHWPKWVYDQYDVDVLVQRVEKELSFIKGLRKAKGRQPNPTDPSELSFWLATQLDDRSRQFLIRLNSPIQRLRWLLSYLGTYEQELLCATCKLKVGKQEDIFAMSTEGAQGTYVNSEGFLHDTLTLLHAKNIALTTTPSTEFSWFPGYAWSIAVCSACHSHVGWQFSTQDPRLKPKKFWGLTRHSLVTVAHPPKNDDCIIPHM